MPAARRGVKRFAAEAQTARGGYDTAFDKECLRCSVLPKAGTPNKCDCLLSLSHETMSAPTKQPAGKKRTLSAEDKETEEAIAWIRRRSREIGADPVKARKYLIEIGVLPNPS